MTGERPALEVRGLSVSVPTRTGDRGLAVRDVTFSVPAGGRVGLVGESGSGKTMTSLAVLGLLPAAARVEAGEILLDGEDLLKKSKRELQQLRGKRLAMVMQDPMTALDPCFTIGSQVAQPLRQHRGLSGKKLDNAVVEALEQVRLSAARDRLRQYPHQLSGGMRQRVTSAIALGGRPRVLIADEPTTALDATTEKRYLKLLRDLQEETGFALLLVAHDLQVVRNVSERVVVMYAGEVVEEGTAEEVFAAPSHPYTRALLGAVRVEGETITLTPIDGTAPDVAEGLPGCRFAPRCTHAREICSTPPGLITVNGARSSRCWGTQQGWLAS
jgi:oligopeptide/dipeptide ABC transporter ATP-binding protein